MKYRKMGYKFRSSWRSISKRRRTKTVSTQRCQLIPYQH